jgi:hypothetical protein
MNDTIITVITTLSGPESSRCNRSLRDPALRTPDLLKLHGYCPEHEVLSFYCSENFDYDSDTTVCNLVQGPVPGC